MKITDLIPDGIKALALSLADKARNLLEGETLRAISYGSAVVVYFAAKSIGSIPDVSFMEAVGQATAGAAVVITITEFARKFVTPVAAPVLPGGTSVTTPSGKDATVRVDR